MSKRYAALNKNDIVNGVGVCVSFWCQGCPHQCVGCHNPETWSEDGGKELPADIRGQIVKAITANGVQRNFSILGGEPLSSGNRKMVLEILNAVRTAYPKIKIFLWSGYTLPILSSSTDSVVHSILDKIDVLIDGKFEIEKRDITLPLRGSSNQNIWEKDGDLWKIQNEKYDKN